jgi:CRP-like cAMP-binding protein
MNKAGLLSTIPMFRGLPAADLEAAASRLRVRHYPKGDVICRQGDPGDSLMIVGSGEATISIAGPDTGKDFVLAVLGPGGAFGELSLLDGEPRSATAAATADSEVYTLSRADFDALLEENPGFGRALNVALARMVRETNQKIADITFLDVHARLAKTLLALCEAGESTAEGIRLASHCSAAELAALCGLHEVETERLLAAYQYEDILRREGSRLVVRRPEALRAWLAMAESTGS